MAGKLLHVAQAAAALDDLARLRYGRVAAHAAETVELNEHRDSGSVALGGKPKLEFMHLAVTAPTPNSAVAVRGC